MFSNRVIYLSCDHTEEHSQQHHRGGGGAHTVGLILARPSYIGTLRGEEGWGIKINPGDFIYVSTVLGSKSCD